MNSYGGINLKCGDPTKGILRIDSSHPIDEHGADDVHVDRCMNNIVGLGGPVGANPGNSAKRITMHTSDGNNWATYPH